MTSLPDQLAILLLLHDDGTTENFSFRLWLRMVTAKQMHRRRHTTPAVRPVRARMRAPAGIRHCPGHDGTSAFCPAWDGPWMSSWFLQVWWQECSENGLVSGTAGQKYSGQPSLLMIKQSVVRVSSASKGGSMKGLECHQRGSQGS